MYKVARSTVLLLLATTVACVEPVPPAPALTVTSPQRGTVQGQAGQVIVTGTAMPGPSGAAISTITVDGVNATRGGDGAFTATVDAPAGLDLIETVAVASDGGRATDTRAVQAGQLTPVGSTITKAVTASLSPDAFAKLSAAAGPLLTSLDMSALLAPMQPMVNLGDDLANLQLSITKLGIGNAKVQLTPAAGGLQFSVELDGLDVGALAEQGGSLVSLGSTTVGITADSVTVSGLLNLAPNGSGGFTTSIASPNISTANLNLQASGLTGQLLSLLQGSLGSTVGTIATSGAQLALQPLVGSAPGAVAGPQHLERARLRPRPPGVAERGVVQRVGRDGDDRPRHHGRRQPGEPRLHLDQERRADAERRQRRPGGARR